MNARPVTLLLITYSRKHDGFLNTDCRILIEMTSEREITIADAHAPAQDLSYIREHDREVLKFLSRSPSSLMGFQGLKRRLGMHQEQLSRALHRLAGDGFVEQTALGYRITQRGLTILSTEAVAEEQAGVTVLQTFMPGNVDAREMVVALKGSWIGPLRWQGLTESQDGLLLSWITEDGEVQLDTRIHGGQLTISAVVAFQERVDEAIRLGHLLFQHISRTSSYSDEFSSVGA